MQAAPWKLDHAITVRLGTLFKTLAFTHEKGEEAPQDQTDQSPSQLDAVLRAHRKGNEREKPEEYCSHPKRRPEVK